MVECAALATYAAPYQAIRPGHPSLAPWIPTSPTHPTILPQPTSTRTDSKA
jgi:hypothetical protein